MKTIFIEGRLDDYQDFHDKNWFETFYNLVTETPLKSAGEHFAVGWWGSVRAFIMPWLLVNGVYDAIAAVSLSPYDRDVVWQEYLQRPEFRVALWKTAENTFVSIYYAYEDYFVQVLKILGKWNSLRTTDKDFKARAKTIIGGNAFNRCWSDTRIDVAREIRHAITHNGGRPTSNLLRKSPLPRIENNDILISGTDVRQLYELLKERVVEFTQSALRYET